MSITYLISARLVQKKKVLFVSKNNIETLRSNKIKIDEIELIDWKPQIRSFIITTSQNTAKN